MITLHIVLLYLQSWSKLAGIQANLSVLVMFPTISKKNIRLTPSDPPSPKFNVEMVEWRLIQATLEWGGGAGHVIKDRSSGIL